MVGSPDELICQVKAAAHHKARDARPALAASKMRKDSFQRELRSNSKKEILGKLWHTLKRYLMTVM